MVMEAAPHAHGRSLRGGDRWRDNYPKLRDHLVKTQNRTTGRDLQGSWDGGRQPPGAGTFHARYVENPNVPFREDYHILDVEGRGKLDMATPLDLDFRRLPDALCLSPDIGLSRGGGGALAPNGERPPLILPPDALWALDRPADHPLDSTRRSGHDR